MPRITAPFLYLLLIASAACKQQRPPREAPVVRPVAEATTPILPADTARTASTVATTHSALPPQIIVGRLPVTAEAIEIDKSEALTERNREALRTFLLASLPQEQRFTLRPGRDTLLLGAQGTKLSVPANAWNVPAGSGPVQVSLREFYSLPAILTAGLNTTTAHGQMLETGGMLHLTASAAGQPVDLRPGAALRLSFPTAGVKPGMQAFRGAVVGNQMQWQPLGQRVDTVKRSFYFNPLSFDVQKNQPKDDYWPHYAGDDSKLRAQLLSLTYAATVAERLLESEEASSQEKAALYAYNAYAGVHKRPKAQRMSEIEFAVDSTGTLRKVSLRPGFDTELAAPALAVVKGWSRWSPAQRWVPDEQPPYKEPVVAVGVVRVVITAASQIIAYPPAWDYDASDEPWRAKIRARQQQRATDKMGAYRARVVRATARANSVTPGADQRRAPTAAALYYELECITTGWINCDRFLDIEPRFALSMPSPGANTKIMLLFQDNRSIMTGTANGQRVSFGQVPVGAKVTVVAMRWQAGKAQLALQPATLSATTPLPELAFQSVTQLQMQQALARLE